MDIVIGAPISLAVTLTNDEDDSPASELLASDLELVLFSDTSKDIANSKTGGTIVVEHPSTGSFIVKIADTDTEKLKPFLGEIGYLEGYIMPCKEPISIELGPIINNRAND